MHSIRIYRGEKIDNKKCLKIERKEMVSGNYREKIEGKINRLKMEGKSSYYVTEGISGK